MSTQTAELELNQSSAVAITGPAIDCIYDQPNLDPDRPLRAARAIVTAVLISVPFWVLLAFTIYLLV
ncbi:MAG TPA: hypothetical protein VHU42_09455 [Rhodopila sp.]|jgi:hypothetical protein|nr:hypothetical protein [Rhodopila sp.]